MLLLALLACQDEVPRVAAIVDPAGAHWLDVPFPSDDRLQDDGTIDLSDFPESGTDLGTTLTGGWARQADEAVTGFSHLAACYFRFEGELEVEGTYAGAAGDPVRLFSLDSEHQVPIETRFVADPMGDPFYGDNTLAIAPDPRHPLRSGERYVAMVSTEIASAASGWEAPAGVPDDAAVATVFTVQDSLGQLQTLRAATLQAIQDGVINLGFLVPEQVLELRYSQGLSPSGNEATIATVLLETNEEELFYMGPEPQAEQTVDLRDDPMEVWQTEIDTVAWQDLAEQPYASPGLGLISDFSRSGDGWIVFQDGELQSTPTAERMRVTIQVPRDTAYRGVLIWDHGTGGSAYNAVQRVKPDDLGGEVRARLAAEGIIVISRDQPLYGTRYPLIDEGFSASLGFYNIGNLPAFRDNQRQAAVDHAVLVNFVRTQLGDFLAQGELPIGTFGHSLGSVTAHLGLAGAQGEGADAALMSGTGGYFTYYVLGTGLLGTDNDVVGMIGPLVDGDIEGASAAELVAALAGLPEDAWPLMDRFHPVMGLFQLIMDPSDPLAVAPDQVVGETIILGVDDLQVPNITTEWLAEALPDVEVITCQKQGDYDGHSCTYREETGLQAFTDFGAALQ